MSVTDVNSAGPYVVQPTDYQLQVRYTATGIISINLPAIVRVGGGRVVMVSDSGYNAGTNNITIVPSGADKVNNVAGNYVINVTASSITLISNANSLNWQIV